MALTAKGYHRPTYNEILNAKISMARNLFGSDIDVSEQTALGKFIRIGAYDLDSAYQDAENIYYSAFLSYATGVSLDRACVFSGVKRNPAQYASATVTVEGTVGYTVPAELQFKTQSGLIYYNSKATKITEEDGICLLTVICTTSGTIGNAEENSINQLVEANANITRVVSSTAATGGEEEESDVDLRKRALSSIEGSGSANINAIRASIMRVQNVESVGIIENNTKQEVDGRPPNSFECYVYGNNIDTQEVAQAIFEKTPIGILTCSTSDDPKHEIVVDASGTKRDIYFSFVEKVGIKLKVTISTNTKFETDGASQIKSSLTTYINSLGVGVDVYQSALFGPVYSVAGVENVASIELSEDGGSIFSDSDIIIDTTAVAQTSLEDIEVVIQNV